MDPGDGSDEGGVGGLGGYIVVVSAREVLGALMGSLCGRYTICQFLSFGGGGGGEEGAVF